VVRIWKSCNLREYGYHEESFADVGYVITVHEVVASRPVPVWRIESGVGSPRRYVRATHQWEGHILRCHVFLYSCRGLRCLTWSSSREQGFELEQLLIVIQKIDDWML